MVDRTDGDLEEASRRLAEGTPAFYVEILGLLDPSPAEGAQGTMTVLQLRHAARESAACAEDLSFEVKAFGNEPFWTAVLKEGAMTYSEPVPEGWPNGGRWFAHCQETPGVGDGRRIFLCNPKGAGPILITLTEERCVDTMSGAWFPLSAEVQMQDRLVDHGKVKEVFRRGCAREGTLGPESAPGN